MGPAGGRYNRVGHNLIEMEMESEAHAAGAAGDREADVGQGGRAPGSRAIPVSGRCRPRLA